MGFTKATKKQSRLRLALIGPSGSGKTYSALRIARGLGGRVALIDTERGSAAKYAGGSGGFDFDAQDLETFAPKDLVRAIQEAESASYDVLIIDSLSHFWMGKGGALDMVDNVAKRSKAGNSFNAWKEVTPEQTAMLDTIIRSRCHVIATMRAKTEYVVDKDERGKSAPRKVGLAPVQRDGVEYEFDVVGMLDNQELTITKSRCSAIATLVQKEPGEELGQLLRAWLTDGAEVSSPALPVATALASAAQAHDTGEAAAGAAVASSKSATIRRPPPRPEEAKEAAPLDALKVACFGKWKETPLGNLSLLDLTAIHAEGMGIREKAPLNEGQRQRLEANLEAIEHAMEALRAERDMAAAKPPPPPPIQAPKAASKRVVIQEEDPDAPTKVTFGRDVGKAIASLTDAQLVANIKYAFVFARDGNAQSKALLEALRAEEKRRTAALPAAWQGGAGVKP